MSRYCPEKDGPALYLDCKECAHPVCDSFFCLVVGSRSFKNYPFLREKLDHFPSNQADVVIVSGGASGADRLAEEYAKEKKLSVKVFQADWEKYGKRAGYIRNDEMHAFLSRQGKKGVVAFWNGVSKGTQHSFSLAKKYGNPIRIVRIKEAEI